MFNQNDPLNNLNNTHPIRKKIKKFKVLECSNNVTNQPQPRTDLLNNLKRERPIDLKDETEKIEQELMQNKSKKKHILHKTEDLFINPKNLENSEIFDPIRIFKTKKFNHHKILEKNIEQEKKYCSECKEHIKILNSEKICINCKY